MKPRPDGLPPRPKDPMAKGPLLDRPRQEAGPKGWITPPPGGPDGPECEWPHTGGPVVFMGPIWNIEGPVIPGEAR